MTVCADSLVLVASQPTLNHSFWFVAGSLLSYDWPDIDHPSNHLHRRLQHYRCLRPLLRYLSHRGVTHSLLAVLLFCIYPVLAVPAQPNAGWLLSTGIAFGYFVHLVVDDCSRQGVMWLYPLTHYRYSRAGHAYKPRWWYPLTYHTGSSVEKIICGCADVVSIVLLTLYMQHRL